MAAAAPRRDPPAGGDPPGTGGVRGGTPSQRGPVGGHGGARLGRGGHWEGIPVEGRTWLRGGGTRGRGGPRLGEDITEKGGGCTARRGPWGGVCLCVHSWMGVPVGGVSGGGGGPAPAGAAGAAFSLKTAWVADVGRVRSLCCARPRPVGCVGRG